MARGVLVPYDGSRRAERALARAVAVCRSSRARLGVAIVQQPVVAVASPWVCTAIPSSERHLRCKLLQRLPDDLSVVFISWPRRPSLRDIVALANRLECDSVVLARRGWRARRAERGLHRRGVSFIPLEEPELAADHGELVTA